MDRHIADIELIIDSEGSESTEGISWLYQPNGYFFYFELIHTNIFFSVILFEKINMLIKSRFWFCKKIKRKTKNGKEKQNSKKQPKISFLFYFQGVINKITKIDFFLDGIWVLGLIIIGIF